MSSIGGIFVASFHRNRLNMKDTTSIIIFALNSENILTQKPGYQEAFAIIGMKLAYGISYPLIFYYHILSEEIKLCCNISNSIPEFGLLFPSITPWKQRDGWCRVSRKNFDIIALTISLIIAGRFPLIANKPIMGFLLPSFHLWILLILSSPYFKWTRW